MAQPTYKPLTMSIIPTSKITSTHQSSQIIPDFQYNYTPNFTGVPTVNDLEQRRLQKGREKVARYNAKVNEYKKLGILDSEKEKVKQLLLICRPYLRSIDTNELDLLVERFLAQLP